MHAPGPALARRAPLWREGSRAPWHLVCCRRPRQSAARAWLAPGPPGVGARRRPPYRPPLLHPLARAFATRPPPFPTRAPCPLLLPQAETGFEKTPAGSMAIPEQEYFDNAVLMVAMVKAGVELAFEEMVNVGLKPESAYYESLHETPLIANTIARMKLHEMNSVISDTAEYGCYIYSQACEPLLKDFMAKVDTDVIGKKYSGSDLGVDNRQLNAVNEAIRSHPVEIIGQELRGYMTDMEKIATKN